MSSVKFLIERVTMVSTLDQNVEKGLISKRKF